MICSTQPNHRLLVSLLLCSVCFIFGSFILNRFQIHFECIRSNKILLQSLLWSNADENKDITSFPLVVSSPLPIGINKNLGGSKFYQRMAYLDIVEQSEGKFYFLVHDIESLRSNTFLVPNMKVEHNKTRAFQFIYSIIERETEEINSTSFEDSHNNESSPIYPTIHPYFSCYRNVEGSYMTMDYLQLQYPDLVDVIDIGPSYLKYIDDGGHELKILKLTNKQNNKINKAPLFVLCGIHARELSPPEACARFAEKMLLDYGENADTTWILDYHEIHIVIQSNPDGREDEEFQLKRGNGNYMRRKNMHSQFISCFRDNGSRFGVDLNRNFPHSAWGTTGVSGRCEASYPGKSPGSEPETQAIVNYMESVLPPGTNKKNRSTGAYLKQSRGVLIDIHSYGQDFFWPYAHSASVISPNDFDLKVLAEKMASFTWPRYTSSNEIYLTSGDTTDWAHEAIGVASFTVEIGNSFYDSCKYFENTILGNTQRFLLYAARIASAPYSLPQGYDILSISLESSNLTQSQPLLAKVQVGNIYSTSLSTSLRNDKNIQLKLYLDDHPNNTTNATTIIPIEEASQRLQNDVFIFTYNMSISFLEIGRHTLFFQAHTIDKDSELPDSIGPIYATYVDII